MIFAANQARLQLLMMAHNLDSFLRRLALSKTVKNWSLRSLQVKLIKMGGPDSGPCRADRLPATLGCYVQ